MRSIVQAYAVAIALIVLGAVSGGAARAQDKLQLIKERQTLMKQQAEYLKALQGYVSGETDRAGAIAKADALLTIPPKIVALFPPGTSLAEFPNETHAKPEIWSQFDRFKEVPAALQRAEERLAAAIKSGSKQDVLDALDTVGRSGCGACHTYFRAPLQ
jgi:cytochrome c556